MRKDSYVSFFYLARQNRGEETRRCCISDKKEPVSARRFIVQLNEEIGQRKCSARLLSYDVTSQICIMKEVGAFRAIFWVSLFSTLAHEIAKEGMSQTYNQWGWNARYMNIFVI